MDKHNKNNNMADDSAERMQAIFGEALGDMPSADETAEALRRIKCSSSSGSSRSVKWLYYAAAILCLPIVVVAVPVLLSHTAGRLSFASEDESKGIETVTALPSTAVDAGNDTVSMFFEFDDLPFIDVVNEVARYYGLSVVVQSAVSDGVRVHFRFPRQTDAAEVVEALNDLNVATLVLEDNVLTVR